MIIPARSGSKRIQNKNMYEIKGVPIVIRTINLLLEVELFSKIIISTDNPALIQLCEKLGVDSHGIRPGHLSSDTATLAEVIEYEVGQVRLRGEVFDEIWLYSATACLLMREDLVSAAKTFAENDRKLPVISVVKSPTPIEWAMNINDLGLLIPNNQEAQTMNSQNFADSFFDAGCFAIYDFMQIAGQEFNITQVQYRPFILPRHRGIDVDNLEDIELVEKLFQSD